MYINYSKNEILNSAMSVQKANEIP